MKPLNQENGITIVALTVTIIVLIILASISIIEGTKLIKKSEVENIVTNMITIKAKAKVIAEEVNSQIWDLTDEEKQNKRESLFDENYQMKKSDISSVSSEITANIDEEVTSGEYEYYQLTKDTLDYMGLSDIEDTDNYVVVYNKDDYTKLDIIYLPGIEHEGVIYYTVSKLQTELNLGKKLTNSYKISLQPDHIFRKV